jgi:hypothetical protein
MSNVPAKIASALFVTAAVGLGAAAMGLPNYTAKAADDCLTEPRDATPQGQHWYYRSERGTGRKCWYLRGEGEPSARADTPAAVASEKPAPRRQEAATTRTIADAHAELPARRRAADDAAPSVWPNPPAATTPQAAAADNNALTSRGSQSAAAAPADSSTAPADQAPEASLMSADVQPDTDADASQQPSAAPPPVAAPPERKTGSIQMLLLVAGGALALAGLTGRAVYRLGRRRTRNDWLRERTNWQSEENPRNPPWIDPAFAQPHARLADLDETHGVAPQSEFAESIAEAEDSDESIEKIEEFLARLSAKLHRELETRGERDAHASS